MTYNGVILTGMDEFYLPSYSIGPYRLRTISNRLGYRVRVLDFIHVLLKKRVGNPRFKKGETSYVDYSEKFHQTLDKIISKETAWIGISSTFLDVQFCNHLRDYLDRYRQERGLSFKIMLGGAKAMYVPPHEKWNYIISGYADNSFVEFLKHVNNEPNELIYERNECNSISIDSNKNYKDIDMGHLRTQWLAEDYIRPTDTLPIEISRGCIFKCAFCYFPLNGKAKFDYFRVKDDMVAELQDNYESWGVTNYLFLDDTYNDSREKLAFMDDVLSELDFKIRYYTYIKPELLVSWPETVQQLVEQGLENAALGIESRNPETRKLIGKGMNYDKIDDACREMYRLGQGKTSITQNYIVGLPKEPIEGFLESIDYCAKTEYITSWSINAMSIQKVGSGTNVYASIIDKNPGAFGYEIIPDDENTKSFLVNWRNEYTTFTEALRIGYQAKQESEKYRKFGGWFAAMVRNTGFDIYAHLNKTISKDIPWNDVRMKGVIRVFDYYDKIINE